MSAAASSSIPRPRRSMQECLLKARFATGTPAGFDLIETMRWRAGTRLPAAATAIWPGCEARRRHWASPDRRRVEAALARAADQATRRTARAADRSIARRRGRTSPPSPSRRCRPARSGRCSIARDAARVPTTRCCATRPRRREVYEAARAEFTARRRRRGPAAQRARRGLRGHDHHRLRRTSATASCCHAAARLRPAGRRAARRAVLDSGRAPRSGLSICRPRQPPRRCMSAIRCAG